MFFKALPLFYIPKSSSAQGFQFPHILANTYYFLFFFFFFLLVSSHPNGLSLMTESSITGHDTVPGPRGDHNEWLLNGMPFGFNNMLNQISLTKAIFVTAQWWRLSAMRALCQKTIPPNTSCSHVGRFDIVKVYVFPKTTCKIMLECDTTI